MNSKSTVTSGYIVKKSDVQETLASLYLRLNGYFVSGFIVHDAEQVKTEMDLLAVRFPHHEEPEREIRCCPYLSPPDNRTDFIIGEVKGGSRDLGFNPRFHEDPDAIRTVLRRIGAFSSNDIDLICREVPKRLSPENNPKSAPLPNFVVSDGSAQIRFMVFAMEQTRTKEDTSPYLCGSDALRYAWTCFRPGQKRAECATRYNFNLWGPLFTPTVRYFKDKADRSPETMSDLYALHGVTD